MKGLEEGCPRYDRCSASLCALDRHVDKRVRLRGERLCGLALLRVKGEVLPEVEGTDAETLVALVDSLIVRLMTMSDARAKLQVASMSKPQGANLKTLDSKGSGSVLSGGNASREVLRPVHLSHVPLSTAPEPLAGIFRGRLSIQQLPGFCRPRALFATNCRQTR
jgi:hypothetical protein